MPIQVQDLDIDVFVNILSFLRPIEVIVASKTSKMFHSATQLRTLWLQVTQIMMQEHGVPHYMYSLESLDTETLKKIATSPARFSSLIKKNHRLPNHSLFPVSARVLLGLDRPDQQLGITAIIELHTPLLFAGGRYVFMAREVETASEATTLCTQIWDIGIPGLSRPLKPILTHMLSCVYARWDVTADPHKACFRLLALKEDDLGLDVYLLYPGDLARHLVPMNSLGSAEKMLAFAHASHLNRAAFVDVGGEVTVWDYQSRLSVRWRIDVNLLSSKLTTAIHLVNDAIFIAHYGSLYQWSVPELNEQEDLHNMGFRSPNHIISPPFFHAEQLPTDGLVTFFATQLYVSPTSPQQLAVFNNHNHFALYNLQLTLKGTSAPKSTAPLLPDLLGSHPLSILPEDKYEFSELRLCDKSSVFWFDKASGPIIVQVTRNEPEVDSISLIEVNLSMGIAGSGLYPSICTVTGRAVFVTSDSNVYIVDYLHET